MLLFSEERTFLERRRRSKGGLAIRRLSLGEKRERTRVAVCLFGRRMGTSAPPLLPPSLGYADRRGTPHSACAAGPAPLLIKRDLAGTRTHADAKSGGQVWRRDHYTMVPGGPRGTWPSRVGPCAVPSRWLWESRLSPGRGVSVHSGSVAQRVERHPYDPEVAGSKTRRRDSSSYAGGVAPKVEHKEPPGRLLPPCECTIACTKRAIDSRAR